MYRPASHILQPFPFQRLLDPLFLVDKRGNDSDTLIPVGHGVTNHLFHFRRRGIFHSRFVISHIHIYQRMLLPAHGTNFQLCIIILFIVEFYNLRITAVMMAKQHLVADRIAGKVGFIDGIFTVVIFFCHIVLLPQFSIHLFIQQDHRIQLLGIPHQHQLFSTDNRHQRYGCIALAGFIHNHHVKHRAWLSQFVCRNAGGDHDGKYFLEPFDIPLITQILSKLRYLIFLRHLVQNTAQTFICGFSQLFNISG